MKKMFLTGLAIMAMSLLCSCGSDDNEETLSEKCRKGDSEACLVGTWLLQAIQDANAGYTIVVDYTTGPGKLIINEDGTFKYTYARATSSLMSADCGGLDDNGKWTFDNATKTISIKFTVGEQCNSDPTTAVVKVSETEMTFDKQVFQTSEDIRTGAKPIEYYKRISIQ